MPNGPNVLQGTFTITTQTGEFLIPADLIRKPAESWTQADREFVYAINAQYLDLGPEECSRRLDCLINTPFECWHDLRTF